MNRLISGENAKQKHTKVVWDEECEVSFPEIKRVMRADTPCLAYPDYQERFKLYTDASESGLGAVLSQVKDGVERPIAFASRTLSKSERNYDAHKLEFLALEVGCDR